MDVYTGNVRGGGTDANVFLTLVGPQAATPKTQLKVCVYVADFACSSLCSKGLSSSLNVHVNIAGL